MDEKLQAQIAEARAQGYTDEQINAYLNPQAVPEAPKDGSQFVDRGEEITGLAQYGVGKAAELGLELGGAYYGGKKLLNAAGNAFRGGPVAPTPTAAPTAPAAGPAAAPRGPTTFTGGANPAFDRALSQPYTPPQANQPGMVQRGMDYARQVQQAAAQRALQMAPAAAAAAVPAAVGAGGAGLTAYATNLLSKMTPEQRKQLMGDIGSDTGLAAAIMNQGQ